MVVMSVQQYVMCSDILQEIVEGCPDSEAETLYEIYIDQLRACGIPVEETEANIYDMPPQFAEWVSELREAL